MKTENEEILSMVKSNFGGYESISLANDDVERLLVIVRHLQKQSDLLTLGLLQEKQKSSKEHDNGYRNGYNAGLSDYAWWKNGVQYVGTCGKTLKQALSDFAE